MMDDLQTPVALIVFNRPVTTRAVLSKIAQIRPRQLFIIADGPRNSEDQEKCSAVRELFDQINWDCQVIKNYADTNLGLRRRVSSGLNWVFEQVEEAIILEDDCVPDLSFFYFCQALLERFSTDNRIMVISGDNFQNGRQRTNYSYYFSRYNHCWGWATWRRAWQYYDDSIALWPLVRDGNWLCDILDNDLKAVQYWTGIFQQVYQEKINSWAFRWTFACWVQNGLTALPNANLVSNIGFGEGATHTHDSTQSLPAQSLQFPLDHPPFIIRDIQADRYTQEFHFNKVTGKNLKHEIGKILRRARLLKD